MEGPAGDLTPIWVPDEQTESLRDLERTRDDARLSERRARQQLLKFLMRHGRRFKDGKTHWTQKHWRWVLQQKFDYEAQNRVLGDYLLTAQQATQRVTRLTQDIQERSQAGRWGLWSGTCRPFGEWSW